MLVGMSWVPCVCLPVGECDLHNVRLHPRFGIEQGKRCCAQCRYTLLAFACDFVVRPDGTVKVRSVDHYSWHAGHRRSKRRRKEASVNGHCLLSEKITHDHVDDIVSGMAKLKRLFAVACDCEFVNTFVSCPGDVVLYHGCGGLTLIQRIGGCQLLVAISGPLG